MMISRKNFSSAALLVIALSLTSEGVNAIGLDSRVSQYSNILQHALDMSTNLDVPFDYVEEMGDTDGHHLRKMVHHRRDGSLEIGI